MLCLSVGKNCSVKYNIDKYIGTDYTYFFDWLITDMDSVNEIMGINNIEDILNIDNIIQDELKKIHNQNSQIMIKSLSKCISIHDIPIEYNLTDIEYFIDKYVRRYNRIIEHIKYNKSVIYFIRNGDITISQKKVFIKNIYDINPLCNFKLVELIDDCDSESIELFENVITLNLQDYKIKNCEDNDWKQSHFDWNKIFNDIAKK